MILDYWYDEIEWSEDKHRHYLGLLEQVAEQRNTDQSIKETGVESFDNKSTPKGPNRTRQDDNLETSAGPSDKKQNFIKKGEEDNSKHWDRHSKLPP